jgi:hypothetical protein
MKLAAGIVPAGLRVQTRLDEHPGLLVLIKRGPIPA